MDIEKNAINVPDKTTAQSVLANIAKNHITTIKLNEFHLSTRITENESGKKLYQCFVGINEKNVETLNSYEELMQRVEEILNSIDTLSQKMTPR